MTTKPSVFSPKELLDLMSWLSPSFPVGSFSYSHGLEYAAEKGLIHDRITAEQWIATILNKGSGHSDSILFLETHRAVRAGDKERFEKVSELATAMRSTSELAHESKSQALAFQKAISSAWDKPDFEEWMSCLPPDFSYPISVATICALSNIEESYSLMAYLHAFMTNLVSAAVRLIPLGQSDGQKIIASLSQILSENLAIILDFPINNIGSAALRVDWTSMKHETQYTRLFRS
jgi:urease accessory protein